MFPMDTTDFYQIFLGIKQIICLSESQPYIKNIDTINTLQQKYRYRIFSISAITKYASFAFTSVLPDVRIYLYMYGFLKFIRTGTEFCTHFCEIKILVRIFAKIQFLRAKYNIFTKTTVFPTFIFQGSFGQ